MSSWKMRLILAIIGVLLAGLAAGSWLYDHFRLNDLPPFQAKSLPPVRPMANIILAPQPSAIPSNDSQGEPPSAPMGALEKPKVHIESDPMEEFRQEVKRLAVKELSAMFPDLR